MNCKICGEPTRIVCDECGEDICRKHPCPCFTAEEIEKMYQQLDAEAETNWFRHAQQMGAVRWKKDKK